MATVADISVKPFKPGSSGWTVEDLEAPEVWSAWESGRYELVEGVITEMPPAVFDGSSAVVKLIRLVLDQVEDSGLSVEPASECDIVLAPTRIVRADGIILLTSELRRSRQLSRAAGAVVNARQKILVPPSLVIESVSLGHESHDRQLKRLWYAEFGVPNYWILDALRKTVDFLRLENGAYVENARSGTTASVRPTAFGGVEVEMFKVWPTD